MMDAFRISLEGGPGRSKGHRTFVPVEQFLPRFPFQFSYVLADSRLGYAKVPGRLSEASFTLDGQEYLESEIFQHPLFGCLTRHLDEFYEVAGIVEPGSRLADLLLGKGRDCSLIFLVIVKALLAEPHEIAHPIAVVDPVLRDVLLVAYLALEHGIDKVVLVDKDTSAQIDSCAIKKSQSRDIDDLF